MLNDFTPKFKMPTIVAATSLLALEAYNVCNIAFMDLPTLIFLAMSSTVTFFVVTHFLYDEDGERKYDKNEYWLRFFSWMVFYGLFGVSLTLVSAYDANTDVVAATRVVKQDTTVPSSAVLAEMKLYSPNNPAHNFLTQYYLLPKKDGNSTIVWDTIEERAAYISDLYHAGELAKTATIPNFGFLPVDKDTINGILGSTDNKLKSKKAILELAEARVYCTL